MKKIIQIFSFVVAFVPLTVYGQTMGKISNFNSLTTRIAAIGNVIVYMLVALAVVYIVWNVVHYLIRPSADDRAAAGMNIFWGLVGLFVIVSLWGLVNILVNTFDTDSNLPRNRIPNADFISKTQNINTVNSYVTNQIKSAPQFTSPNQQNNNDAWSQASANSNPKPAPEVPEYTSPNSQNNNDAWTQAMSPKP